MARQIKVPLAYTTEGNQLFRTYQTGNIGKSQHFETSSVWSYTIQETSYPIVFYSPEIGDPTTLPPNHHLWDHVDTILEKLWAEGPHISPDVDDEWLDTIRASWNNHIEDLYNESDAGE